MKTELNRDIKHSAPCLPPSWCSVKFGSYSLEEYCFSLGATESLRSDCSFSLPSIFFYQVPTKTLVLQDWIRQHLSSSELTENSGGRDPTCRTIHMRKLPLWGVEEVLWECRGEVSTCTHEVNDGFSAEMQWENQWSVCWLVKPG